LLKEAKVFYLQTEKRSSDTYSLSLNFFPHNHLKLKHHWRNLK